MSRQPGSHPESALERHLSAYQESVRVNVTPARTKQPFAWPAYATAVGSALAFTTAAEANIIYSGVQNVTAKTTGSRVRTNTTLRQPKTFHMKVKGTAAASRFGLSLIFRQNSPGMIPRTMQAKALLTAPFPSGGVLKTGGKSFLKLLTFGKRIGPLSSGATSKWGGAGRLRSVFHGKSAGGAGSSKSGGNWKQSRTGFAGVRFSVGASKGKTNFDYGWVRLEWKDPNKTGYPTILTAIDWAYDNVANQPITSGDEGLVASVPEPSSLALALLAAGVAGVLAWRQHRSATPPGDREDMPGAVP
jgi:PEP-CTERM motif